MVLYRLTQSDPALVAAVTSPKVVVVLSGPWFRLLRKLDGVAPLVAHPPRYISTIRQN